MKHTFFDELREESTKLPGGVELPELFDFSPEERSAADSEIMGALVPDWYGDKKEKQNSEAKSKK